MKNKEFLALIKYLILCLYFVFLFFIGFIIQRQFFPGNYLFYNGILTAIISIILGAFFISILKKISLLSLIPAALTSLFIAYAFIITVPVTLDRAMSIYLIDAIASEKDGISFDTLKNKATRDLWESKIFLERRLDEQLYSKNIMFNGEKYFPTKMGIFIYRNNIFLGKLFNIQSAYILPNSNQNE